MPTVKEELARLKRDIDGLLEANRLDWVDLAEKPMTRDDRVGMRKQIALRNVDLIDLLDRVWATIEDRKI